MKILKLKIEAKINSICFNKFKFNKKKREKKILLLDSAENLLHQKFSELKLKKNRRKSIKFKTHKLKYKISLFRKKKSMSSCSMPPSMTDRSELSHSSTNHTTNYVIPSHPTGSSTTRGPAASVPSATVPTTTGPTTTVSSATVPSATYINSPTLVQHGRFKFLILDAPHYDNIHSYIHELKKNGVTDLVRTCERTYDEKVVIDAGVTPHVSHVCKSLYK